MYGIIYKATGPDDRVYIGQTVKTLKRRKSQHAFRTKKGDRRGAFHIALLELGFSSFTWDQIDNAETAGELDAKEKQWIAYYKADNPAFGYNIFEGGSSPRQTQESRQKLSEATKGRKRLPFSEETRRKMSEANKGRKLTPEQYQKMCKALKGRKLTSEHRQKISEGLKGTEKSAKTRQKISAGHKGKTLTTETRRKISEATRGEKCRLAKITEETARLIKTDIQAGMRNCDVVKKYGVSRFIVEAIKYGDAWAWVEIA